MDASFHLDEDGIYRCQAFQPLIWQSHGFGTRRANPSASLTLRQIHSDVVWNARGLSDRKQEGDALITDEIGLSIGVRTADCVPILLMDTNRRAIAAVHAGWRGSAAGIVSAAIQKMSLEFGSQPADFLAAIGPCVRECCYQVGPEVISRFQHIFPEWPEGQPSLDLAEANVRQMKAAGVAADRIFDSCLCTCCQIETFYSYRREPGEAGRMTAAIARLS